MKKSNLLLAMGAMALSVTGFAQAKKKPAAPANKTTQVAKAPQFKKDAHGLEYMFIEEHPTHPMAKFGDQIEAHINQRIGDSLMYSSIKINNGTPLAMPIMESPIKGDLVDALVMMHVGDSAVFRSPLDSLVARSKQPKPSWAKDGEYIQWEVRLLGVKTKEQIEEEHKKATELAAVKAKEQVEIDEKLIKHHLDSLNIKNAQRTASGLYYVMHKVGEGPMAEAGKKVTVNYTGINMLGEPFDSNVDPAFHHVEPFTFDLGRRNVIQGWDEGVALMKKGGKITLYIPSGLAYGPNARGPKIPANAILIFDIELLDIQ